MRKSNLRTTVAWQALALLGAGVPAAFIAATPAMAQDYTRGNIVGTVTDDKGAPVSGATVSVVSNEQGTRSATTTDSNGTFRVTALATGTYTVVVQVAGATVVEDRAASVVAGQNNSFAYRAGVAGAAADPAAVAENGDDSVVVVTGSRTKVDDFSSTQTGATLDVQELVETVPLGRDQTSLILLAPGTTGGDAGFGNLASISGATVAENAYFVNGLNITDFRGFLGASLIPFEFYRTLDVKTGGYQAEYGRALGGVTSAVTKAGSNDFKAGAVIAFSPNWARETSKDTYLARNSDDSRQNIDANFYASGPIIKDRLFVYGLYSPRFFKNEDTSKSARARLSTRSSSPFYGAKIDAVITDGHRIEGTLFSDRQIQKTRYTAFDIINGDLEEVLGSAVSTSGGRSFIGTYTGQFTDFFTLSGSYGRTRSLGLQRSGPNVNFIQSRLTGSPVVAGRVTNPGQPCNTVGPCTAANDTLYTAFGSVAQNLNDDDLRKVWRVDADFYVNLFGAHHFRAGTDYEELTAKENTTNTGDGFTYDFRQNQVRRTFYRNQGTFKTDMRAVYLQDSWSLLDDRVNLQLGVRGDKFRNYAISGDKYYDSGYNWAPRLGATIDVFGDKRTKLNLFYGTYYLPVATNTNIRLGGAELFYRQRQNYASPPTDNNQDGIPDQFIRDPLTGAITNFVGNSGSAACPTAGPNAGQICSQVFSDGVAGPTDTLIAKGLKPSESNEIIVGMSHRIGGGWTVGVDYVRRRLKETLEDVAIDAAVLAYCDREGVAGCDSVFTGFHQYVLANPGSDITVRLDGDCTIPGQCDVVTLAAADLGYPKAVRKYDAVQFTLDKAFNGLYGFNANYVYTKLRGNFEGGVKSDNNQTDTGLTQDFDQPGLVDGATGDLANGRKHAFKFYGRVTPFKGVDIGVNGILESPRKFSCIGNYFDPANFAAAYGAASYYCQQPDVGGTPVAGTSSFLVPRGTAFKTQWNKRVDLGVGFDLAPMSLPGSSFRVDVFNLFNWDQVLDRNEFGDISFGGPNPDYKKITGYQAPRSVRFTLSMRFGEK